MRTINSNSNINILALPIPLPHDDEVNYKLRGRRFCPICLNPIFLYSKNSLPKTFQVICPSCDGEIALTKYP